MLEVVGTVVAIEENLDQPVTHLLKLTNVRRVAGDQCAGETRQILFLSQEESHRYAEGQMGEVHEFVYPMLWLPIELAPQDGTPLRLFAESLIDPDFNESGSVDGFWQDDEGWVGAVWNSCHDCWDRQVIKPSHFQTLPSPPVS